MSRTLSTINIDPEHSQKLTIIAKKFNRSKTKQLHQMIEDLENSIKENSKN